jgi:hypothetical protein
VRRASAAPRGDAFRTPRADCPERSIFPGKQRPPTSIATSMRAPPKNKVEVIATVTVAEMKMRKEHERRRSNEQSRAKPPGVHQMLVWDSSSRRSSESPRLTGNAAKRKSELVALEVLRALRTRIPCDCHLRYEKQHQSNPHGSDPERFAVHGSSYPKRMFLSSQAPARLITGERESFA